MIPCQLRFKPHSTSEYTVHLSHAEGCVLLHYIPHMAIYFNTQVHTRTFAQHIANELDLYVQKYCPNFISDSDARPILNTDINAMAARAVLVTIKQNIENALA